jgi:hypothetical protein
LLKRDPWQNDLYQGISGNAERVSLSWENPKHAFVQQLPNPRFWRGFGHSSQAPLYSCALVLLNQSIDDFWLYASDEPVQF